MAIFLIIFLSLVLLYLLAIAPRIFKRREMSVWLGQFFAHRGFHNSEMGIPENSLPAFKKAVEYGYGIELDVRITKDHVPVVFHDADLSRMCRVEKRVSELTFAELNHYSLGQSAEKIPSLADVLALIDGKAPLIIEFKADHSDVSICDYAQPLLDEYKGPYCIESFNPLVLLWYKKNRPAIIRGQLSSRMLVENKNGSTFLNFLLQQMLFNWITKPDFIAFNHKYTHLLAFKICRKLYKAPTFGWTIVTQEELDQAKPHFDSYIFEKFLPND